MTWNGTRLLSNSQLGGEYPSVIILYLTWRQRRFTEILNPAQPWKWTFILSQNSARLTVSHLNKNLWSFCFFFSPCFAYCKQDNLDVPFHRWKADNCISVSFTSGSRISCEHFRLITELDEGSAAPPAALPIEVSSQRALKGLMFTERNDGLRESIRFTHSRAQPHINFRSVTFVFENNMHSKAIIYPALKEY